MLSWVEKVRTGARRFLRSDKGAIAPMFGLLLVPMTLALGVSVDIGRAIASRNDLQDALDATGLALSHMGYSSSTPTTTVTSAANAWMIANVHNKDICGSTVADPNNPQSKKCNNVTLSVTPSTQNVTLVASATVNTLLGGLAGIRQVPISATTVVQWGLSHVEVALVLDNTGSMSADNKLPTLISSAKTLVNTLFSQNTSGDPNAVRISVVPFTQTVNVGASYQTAAWMTGSLPATYATSLTTAYSGLSWPNGTDIFTTAGVNRFTLFSQMHAAWGGCVESRPAPYDAQDTGPAVTNPSTLFVPYFAPDEPGNGATSYGYNTYFTNDYLQDGLPSYSPWLTLQGNPLKYTSTPRSGSAATGYAFGPNAGCTTVQPLMRLSTDQSAILSEINAMQAGGDTNLNIGFMWGWHTLSPNAPFSDGVAYGTPNVKKIIVFLTDGWNEATSAASSDGTYYSGIGYAWQNRIGVGASASQSQRASALDSRTLQACQNAQSAGIIVYTVRIDVANSQSPAVLQACASSASDFYDVPNVSNLPAAFTAIAGSIGHLRISQ